MLINLKRLAIQRSKVIGHEELADKFDLKTLRCLGAVFSSVYYDFLDKFEFSMY